MSLQRVFSRLSEDAASLTLLEALVLLRDLQTEARFDRTRDFARKIRSKEKSQSRKARKSKSTGSGGSNAKKMSPHKFRSVNGPSGAKKSKYAPPPKKEKTRRQSNNWSCKKGPKGNQLCTWVGSESERRRQGRARKMPVNRDSDYMTRYNKSYKDQDRVEGWRRPGGKSYRPGK